MRNRLCTLLWIALSLPNATFAQSVPISHARDSTIAGGYASAVRDDQAGAHRAPYLKLSAGRSVITRHVGEAVLTRAMTAGEARALSVAAGDFDEDGMPDLVGGFATADGGVLSVHRGNIDALWSYGALRKSEPSEFLPDARVFAVPEAPDLLAAGDFDADGHWDIVAGRAGGNALYFLRGDGRGGFAQAERIALPGSLTAMTSGEINRADGLTDLMVAVTGKQGAQVLVFESPAGALRGAPETFSLPAAASALAVMPLDGASMNGLAVAAGHELLLIHGRDRMLTRSVADRDHAPAATITRQTFAFALRSLAVGNFTSATQDLAALGDDGALHILERSDAGEVLGDSTHFSLPQHAAGVAASRAPSLRAVEVAPKTTAMNLRTAIGLPSTVGNAGVGAKLVTARVAATGRDSLVVIDPAAHQLHVVSHRDREDATAMSVSTSIDIAEGAPAAVAAMRLNRSALRDLVVLAAPQSAPIVFKDGPDFVLVVVNSKDDGNGSLRETLTFANLLPGLVEIDFDIPLTDPNRDPVTGVFTIQPVGLNDLLALPNLGGAIILDGYTQPGASPNTLANGDNAHPLIEINGSMAGSGPSGIQIFGEGATVRGLILTNFLQAPVPGVVGTTHGGAGIDIESSHNVIEGNFIGIDASGTFAKPNYLGIISFGGESGNLIGGTTPQSRNIISGNNFVGIGLQQSASVNSYLIHGNYIGTDKTGTKIVPNNVAGVGLEGLNAVLGGTTAGTRNIIAGNKFVNVAVARGCTDCLPAQGNLVLGNFIGTDLTGTHALTNSIEDGVSMSRSTGDTVGGTTAAARNVIAGSGGQGVDLFNGNENAVIQGNYIGVDVTGTAALGNGGFGVAFGTDYYDLSGNHFAGVPSFNNLVGGETAGARNVISGNGQGGISIISANSLPAQNNVITGNLIGTDAAGVNALGNHGNGLLLTKFATGNIVGGTDPAAANVIAFNTGDGVRIDPGAPNTATFGVSSNAITGNAIHGNGGAGVRIPSGTGNPVSRNLIDANGGLGIDLDAAGVLANSACQANTAGANLLQNAPVLTAGSGSTFVTATATDPAGNTSEFSNCVATTIAGNVLNIAGSFDSKPSTTYTIEYFSNASCDGSGFGEGKVYLGSSTVTTNGSCTATIANPVNVTNADLGVTNASVSTFLDAFVYVPFQFTSVIGNNGPIAATGIVWTDVLPAGTLYVDATSTQGTCAFSAGTITCNIGALPVGGTVTVSASFAPTTLTAFSNTVGVAASTPDANTANNSATVTRTVVYDPYFDHLSPASVTVGSPDLTLTLVGQGFYSGSTVTYNGTLFPATFDPGWDPDDCGNSLLGGPGICTALTITVPAALLTSPTTVPVNVVTTGISTGSETRNFSVVAPVVPPGPVNHFVLTGIPNPYSAGALEGMFVTAEDAAGHTIPGYRGTVNLTSTDPDPDVFTNGGGSATHTFTAAEGGVFLALVTLQTHGPQSVTVTDAADSSITGTISTVVGAGPAGVLTVSGTPQAALPGHAFALPLGVLVTDLIGNPVTSQLVTFTVPGSGASAVLSSSTAMTDSSGFASVTATANATAGAYAVGVTFGAEVAGGKNSGVYLLTNGSGLATLTATAGTPQSTFIGQLFPTHLQATLLDGLGNPISGATVYFDTGNVGGAAALVTAAAVTNASGVASALANAPSNASPGTFPVTASVGGLTATFTLTELAPEPVVLTIVSGTPQSTAAGFAFALPLAVHVTDGFGTARPGVVVTYVPPASGASATMSAGTASTDASGNANLTATANGVVGTYNVVASVGGISVDFALTNTTPASGPAASITAVAGTPQSQFANQAFTTDFKVLVKNASNQPLPGASVTFTAPASGATGTFAAPATVITDGGGFATAPTFTANTVSGSYNVTAATGALSTNFALTNLGGAPVSISIFAGNNQTAALNSAFATPLAVQLFDTFGNPVAANWGGTFFIVVAGASGASATFTGNASSVTDSNGVATAPTLTSNGIAGDFTVLAFLNFNQFVTFNLTNSNVVATPPTKLAVTSVNGGASPTAGAAFDVVVQAQDGASAAQNVLASTPVTLSRHSGTGTLGGTLTCTIAAGTNSCTVTGVTYSIAQSGVSVTATRTGGDALAAGNSAPFTVVAAAPTKLAVTSVNGGVSPIVGAAFNVVVQAQDGNSIAENVIASTPVTLSRATGTGTLGGTLTCTIAAGANACTVTGVTYSVAESGVSVTATRTGGDALAPGNSAVFTVAAVAPTKLAVTSVNGGASPTAGAAFDVVVQAQDGTSTAQNVLASTPVTLSRHSGTGTLGGTLTCTIAVGTNSCTVTGVTYSIAQSGVSITATRTGGDALAAGNSAPFTVIALPPTKLAVTSVNGGASPIVGAAFNVVVQAQDGAGNAENVGASTPVTLSRATGTGTLGGTLACTIAAGSNGCTVIGVTYSVAESGVSVTATRTGGDALAPGNSALFTVAAVAPTKLAVTSVNGGASPTAGVAFDVVVQAQDGTSTAQNVLASTPVTLSRHTGTGTLGGTLTCTISAGTNACTVTGVTYSIAQSGVSVTATRTGGDALAAGNSAPFTVIALPPTNLAVTSVDGGANPTVGAAFNVVVRAQDGNSIAENVIASTPVTLSLDTGTGALGGTLTCTISAGANSCTVSGVTYSVAESGVSITATRTGGDALAPGNSAPFTVVTAPVCFAAPSATGTGTITACFTGGGASCDFTAKQFIGLAGDAASPPAGTAPAGVSFPQGLFAFTAGSCTAGSALHFTITYPQSLPAGTQYYKYGPTSADASPHWYVLPNAVVSGNTVTFAITDAGLGDDDYALGPNGIIVDQGGPGAPVGAASTANSIPTLDRWMLAMLACLLVAASALQRRPWRRR